VHQCIQPVPVARRRPSPLARVLTCGCRQSKAETPGFVTPSSKRTQPPSAKHASSHQGKAVLPPQPLVTQHISVLLVCSSKHTVSHDTPTHSNRGRCTDSNRGCKQGTCTLPRCKQGRGHQTNQEPASGKGAGLHGIQAHAERRLRGACAPRRSTPHRATQPHHARAARGCWARALPLLVHKCNARESAVLYTSTHRQQQQQQQYTPGVTCAATHLRRPCCRGRCCATHRYTLCHTHGSRGPACAACGASTPPTRAHTPPHQAVTCVSCGAGVQSWS
jgi:hypothetical protein